MDFRQKSKQISAKFSKLIFNIFRWARRTLLLGPKGPTVAAESCSPLQELEKAARRAAIFLVYIKINLSSSCRERKWNYFLTRHLKTCPRVIQDSLDHLKHFYWAKMHLRVRNTSRNHSTPGTEASQGSGAPWRTESRQESGSPRG